MLRALSCGARGVRMRRALTTTSKSTDHFTALAVLFAVALAAGLLMLAGTKPAEAAFPGINGKIAFMSDRTTGAGVDNPTGDFEIFTINQAGTGLTQLTTNTADDGLVEWSRSGKKIVFVSDRDGNAEVYTMNLDGSAQTNISNDASSDSLPTFSPDGTKVAFRSDRTTGVGVDNPTGDLEIFTINLDGTGLTQLTKNTVVDSQPTWSPNGQQIAFTSDRNSGNDEIYTMNSDGSVQTRRTNNSISDTNPAYSPDDKQIVFDSARDGNSEIYRMQVSGSLQTLLSNNPANDQFPDWQPLKKRRG